MRLHSFLKNPYVKWGIVSGIALCLVGVVLFSFRWYPVAFVEGHIVFASEYAAAEELSYNYYSYFSQKNQNARNDESLRREIPRIVLQGLIDSVLVERELRTILTSKDLQRKVDEKIQIVWSDEQSRQMILNMTKMSERKTRTYFLENEARNQLLDGYLRLRGLDLYTWLSGTYKDARVKIFLKNIQWTEKGVLAGT